MVHMNRTTFQEEFEYDVANDFSVKDVPASWAVPSSGGKPAHRFWGDEDHHIDPPSFSNENHYASNVSAISADHRFLAIAGNLISVYDTKSLELCAQFRGPPSPCQKLVFAPGSPRADKTSYSLVGQFSGNLMAFPLSVEGSRIDAIQPVASHELAAKAIDSILPDLTSSYELSTSSFLLASMTSDFEQALEKLSAELETSNLITVSGVLPTRSRKPFSPDGRLLISLMNNDTTQSKMRPVEDLPAILVHDLDTQKLSLTGHTDKVLWGEFSPDGQTIASVAWDGTLKLWDANSGECIYTCDPTGGQLNGGTWSPDSKHVCISGSERTEGKLIYLVAVHSRDLQKEVKRFSATQSGGTPDKARSLDWSENNEVAIASASYVHIWQPFEDKLLSTFQMTGKDSIHERMRASFGGPHSARWVAQGSMLIAKMGDGTIEVWDRRDNAKWRFQKPKGSLAINFAKATYWLEKERMLIGVDGDGRVRFWML